jgi:hypothetical protein
MDFFNQKRILDCYFYLKSGPVFLFQMFTIKYTGKYKYQPLHCTFVFRSIANWFSLQIRPNKL